MAVDHYKQFVDEAFIAPIRSVLIVDDDYPTFEEMLSDGELSAKEWRNAVERERVKKVIRSFRKRSLLVDIHDGQNVGSDQEIAEVEHLHQSDLLVLDYQLDKLRVGDGSIAINIIRKLMSNAHFNLVIVHATENLDAVYQNVIMALVSHSSCSVDGEKLENVIEAVSTAGEIINDFQKKIGAAVSTVHYLKFKQVGLDKTLALFMQGDGIFNAYAALCDQAKWERTTRKLVLQYLLEMFGESKKQADDVQRAQEIDWSDNGVKWVRSDTVFVAFSNKKVGEEPMEDLSVALNAWRPDPSRLYLARLQHEIDEHGTALQAQVLGNPHALAEWYHGMLTAGENETRTQISETIARHSERLMKSVGPSVAAFAERLVIAERATDTEHAGDAFRICKTHFDVDLQNKAQRTRARSQHNSVVSSKAPDGWHLTTGHVFKFADHHWVCASPACDMVPSQLSAFRRGIYQDRMPFTAIRLQPVPSMDKALDKASSSRILFLELDGDIAAFSFNDVTDDTSAPQWSPLFAENLGRFDQTTHEFKIVQVESDEGQLQIKSYDAKVVSQLRYEYALNLVQRLGVSMSRIGLDFSGSKPQQ